MKKLKPATLQSKARVTQNGTSYNSYKLFQMCFWIPYAEQRSDQGSSVGGY